MIKIDTKMVLPQLTSILGHLKPINFPSGTNENLMVLGVPILNASVLGHLKTINFPFVPNGKLMVLGVPKQTYIMVYSGTKV